MSAALFVVAGAEVAVGGCRVGQQGVGDDELGSHDGALGFLLGHVPDQAPVLGAQEGLGAAGADGGLAEGGADVGVAAAGGALALALAAGLADLGRLRGPRSTGARRSGRRSCRSPISAIMSWAVITPKPGIASSWAICRSYGSHSTSILAVQHGDLGGEWSMLSSIIDRTKACCFGEERAVQGLFQRRGSCPASGRGPSARAPSGRARRR